MSGLFGDGKEFEVTRDGDHIDFYQYVFLCRMIGWYNQVFLAEKMWKDVLRMLPARERGC